ncbi:MAG: tetratricopeptide repeat protein [Betaproteobacteria bacterium]|nr:tetratricopeptide repeat protein [Betaproteobacteria bacterium]MCL2887276.1 tetratricopeptide repeat protein [Betaproteobacteria bacterium]
MAMSINPLAQPCFRHLRHVRAALFGLAIGLAASVFADDLPEIQRLIRQGQYPQALEKVDAYLAPRPKDAQGRFLKGLIYTEMNKPVEAIGVFTRLSEDYPELPEPYNNLAVLYAQQRQYDKARTALEMAIRTHPSYAIAYENLGDVYAKLASQAYGKALELDAANAGTQNKLSLIRDLISTSGTGNVKPAAVKVAEAKPVVENKPATEVKPVTETKPATETKPVAETKPTVSVVSSTPGGAGQSSPPPKADVDEDIARAINAWASAWEGKDMKAYLAAYAADFRPPQGLGRKDWEAERTQRIAGKGGKISVVIKDLQTTVSGDSATVRFRQHYKAPGLNSATTKTMTLRREGGRWLIQEENVR